MSGLDTHLLAGTQEELLAESASKDDTIHITGKIFSQESLEEFAVEGELKYTREQENSQLVAAIKLKPKKLEYMEEANIPDLKQSQSLSTEKLSRTRSIIEEENEKKVFAKYCQKIYPEFLRWKVFENEFQCNSNIDLLEIDTEDGKIAFRIAEKHIIVILGVKGTEKIVFQEGANNPIKFLKFVQPQGLLLMANEKQIYGWNFSNNRFEIKINIENLFKDLTKNMNSPTKNVFEQLDTKKDNANFMFNLIEDSYCLHFNLGNFIILIRFDSNLKKFDFKYDGSKGVIINHFFLASEHLLLSVAKNDEETYEIKVFKLMTLKRLLIQNLIGACSAFYAPSITKRISGLTIRLKLLVEEELKFINFELNSVELKSKSTSYQVISTNGLCDLNLINRKFISHYKIEKIWHADDEMIIFKPKLTDGNRIQCIYNSKLLIKLETDFKEDFTEIIVSESKIFAYKDRTLFILAVGSNKFKVNLEFKLEIESIKAISDYVLINLKDYSCLLKIKTDNQGVCKVLNVADSEKFKDLNSVVRSHIANMFCCVKDAKSLSCYLAHKDKFNTSQEVGNHDNPHESLDLGSVIDGKSSECLKVLLAYFIRVRKDKKKQMEMANDIEKNFNKILQSNASNLIEFLNSLLNIEKVAGELTNENVPGFKFYECPSESLHALFFNQNPAEISEFEIHSTKIRLPEVHGSKDSIELTKSLMNCDKSIFSSELIRYYINSKWDSLWFLVLLHTAIIWANCALVLFVIMIDPFNLPANIALICLNVVLFLFEGIQVTQLGIEEYLGINKKDFFWHLSFMVALGFLFTKSVYLVIPYTIVQLLSLHYDLKVRLIEIAIRSFPFLVYIASILFALNLDYPFFMFIAYELCLYVYSFFRKEAERISRNYVRITALLVYLAYFSFTLAYLLHSFMF